MATDSDNMWREGGLVQRHRHLLVTGFMSDCTFLVGVEGGEKKRFKCHKFILGHSSSVFYAMFTGGLDPKEEVTEITDCQPEHFQQFLEYMYLDTVELNDLDTAMGLAYTAKKYFMKTLLNKCLEFINLHFEDPQNVCQVLEFSRLIGAEELEKKCIDFIKANINMILADENFEHVERATLMTILEQDKLCIRSEVDLFSACLRWARSNNNNDKTEDENGLAKTEEENGIAKTEDENELAEAEDENGLANTEEENGIAEVEDENELVEAEDENGLANTEEENGLAKAEDENGIATTLGPALKIIRFLTFTANEFANLVVPTKILSEKTCLAILFRMITGNGDIPGEVSNCCDSRSILESIAIPLLHHNAHSSAQVGGAWSLTISTNISTYLNGVQVLGARYNAKTGEEYVENIKVVVMTNGTEHMSESFVCLLKRNESFEISFKKSFRLMPGIQYMIQLIYHDPNISYLTYRVHQVSQIVPKCGIPFTISGVHNHINAVIINLV